MTSSFPRRTGLMAAALAAGLASPVPALAMGDPSPPKPSPRAAAAAAVPAWDRGRRPAGRHPWDRRPGHPLHPSSPRAAGLDEAWIEEVPEILRAAIAQDPPRFAGASVLVAVGGGIVLEHAEGDALRWADATTQLPETERILARTDTIFDLASLSKLFTATAVLQLVEQGRVSLEDPVARHVPRFGENGKQQILVRHLLTHTGGLPAFLPLYSDWPDEAARWDAALTATPTAAPEEGYLYSDLGLIALGRMVEELSGQRLDAYVHDHITAPLGMTDTMYTPDASLRPRIAATEYQEFYGELVHGRVHDENAYALGGVAGHAGVFSTAKDVAVFASMLLGGGKHRGARVLERATVQDMFTDRIAGITGEGGARRGLGPELTAWAYHSGLTSPFSGAHTGFTGTSLVIDPLTDTVIVLLTNAVHPTREWSSTNAVRREVSTAVARAHGILPAEAGWLAGQEDTRTATLTASADLPSAGEEPARLEVELFAHLETAYDTMRIEASADGGATWAPLAGALERRDRDRGRPVEDLVEERIELPDGVVTGWGGRLTWRGGFDLVDAGGAALAGEVQVRAAVTTDKAVRGLGALVGRIAITRGGETLLDTDREADAAAVSADGWERVGRS